MRVRPPSRPSVRYDPKVDSREEAERKLASGFPDQAIEAFRALIAETPGDPTLRGRLAEAYAQAGNVDRAFYHFDQAARSFATLGDAAAAADNLARADALLPDQAEILFRWAKALLQLEDQASLKPLCTRLARVASAPGDRRRLWALDQLEAHGPGDLELAELRARAQLDAGQVEDASETFVRLLRKLAAVGPVPSALLEGLEKDAERYPELRRPLAEAALMAGEPQKALDWLGPLADARPDAIPVLEVTLRTFDALDLNSRATAARCQLAKALLQAERAPEATPLFEALLDSPDVEHLEVAATGLSTLGRLGLAGAAWGQVIRGHHEAGRAAARDRAILQLLKFSPDAIPGLRIAAEVLAESGREAEAERLAARIGQLEAPHTPPDRSSSTPAGHYGRGLSFGSGRSDLAPSSVADTQDDLLGDDDVDFEVSDTEDLVASPLEMEAEVVE